MAPLIKGWYRHAVMWVALSGAVLMGLAPWSAASAAPKFANVATLPIDAGATIALPRGWGPARLSDSTPIPSITKTINSPFGPSRLVFAQQAAPAQGFALVTVRKSDFDKGSPQYLETLRPRDLAILLNHMESRVHGAQPAWAVRLIHSKPPAQQLLGGQRVIYWEGEWHTSTNQTVTVRGYAFFGNGAVYLLRVFGTAGRGQPDYAEEARFANAVAATLRTK